MPESQHPPHVHFDVGIDEGEAVGRMIAWTSRERAPTRQSGSVVLPDQPRSSRYSLGTAGKSDGAALGKIAGRAPRDRPTVMGAKQQCAALYRDHHALPGMESGPDRLLAQVVRVQPWNLVGATAQSAHRRLCQHAVERGAARWVATLSGVKDNFVWSLFAHPSINAGGTPRSLQNKGSLQAFVVLLCLEKGPRTVSLRLGGFIAG